MNRTLILICMFLLVLAWSDASALCPIFPTHVRVGADAANCAYNDIQSAINAVGSCPVVIDITKEHTYGNGGFCTPNQSGGCHLNISAKTNVTLQGWGDGITCEALNTNVCEACGPGQTIPLVTLDGGNSGGPVLSISGASNVSVRNLTITHGATAYDGSGGGIAFSGSGSLLLEDSTVGANYAGYGGGINMNGSGAGATLTLNAYTLVLNNTAQFSGGGVRLEGNAILHAVAAQTLIGFNSALGHDPVFDSASGGYGGGVEIIGPASASIGSSGYGAGGAVVGNDAVYGGGISVNAGQNDGADAMLRLFTTDAGRAVDVDQNFASARGGGVYLKSYISFGLSGGSIANAVACLSNFRISANTAPDGPAIYADYDSDAVGVDNGGYVQINRSLQVAADEKCEPGTSAGLGEVACAPGVACNEIADNIAQDGSGQPTGGSVLFVGHEAELAVDRLAMRRNSGGMLIRQVGEGDPGLIPQTGTPLRNCLLVDNTAGGDLISAELYSSSPLELESCTIANNAIGGTAVMHYEDGLKLLDTLVDQAGKPTADGITTKSAQYVLATEISTLPADVTVQQLVADAKFADPANGDYHLQLTSPAVDYAGGIGGSDLDGYPRDVDLAAKANAFGPRDIGAYERQSDYACDNAPDALFCSGFDPP